MKIKGVAFVLGVMSLGVAGLAQAETISAAGGTAIYPVLSKWAETYKQKTGIMVNYQAIGSGGGIAQIKAKTVAFANSDMPLQPEYLNKDQLVQFPAVIIGITPVVNVPGIKPGELTFNGAVLTGIYLGKIKKWNDAAIADLNKGVHLPDMNITVVHRSDGSGTTFNFTNYLAKVSPEWKQRVGDNTAVSWPVGVGGKGNAGVAAYVQRIPGAIGYVEYAYAKENHMAYGKMINAAGKVVAPDLATFQAAAANADFTKVEDFYVILTNQPGAQSWPISAATYILMRQDAHKTVNAGVLKFARWFLTAPQAQAEARGLDYVPLPKTTVTQIEAYWKRNLGQ
ncbi:MULTISPECIES: phosphate ABC transporter substrate-binding protein PstS [Acidithiobacillus]|jgi:phosphate transport system substrate-binding protein|uniref:Phosphate-binding protein PstS n=2 Tax=Acidithiobacillus ferrooxidans TaxID=920 RepID=B7J9N3_ACIF2|nr:MULTISPECIES: phosphate ABC transporter substrate-binding protein PstS [Acidithiobacillus]MCL5956170.1 phosphate ABC transporter substrate-binding protein PstS [Gammaproteobacteria bacterium]ACH83391.1 phosphate ABC transporter, periplasmic phosphate-binding protein [Acidithiobacillus ferrooxidans ATCC 53993]ACK78787.1 phosphate ABC transporter, periplasmic phosphate-binding protein [Acidithiobacillus ferrooxidans ATCC 23270]MBN6744424.1 phosphate ABC transporter substrate-binding protein Ps